MSIKRGHFKIGNNKIIVNTNADEVKINNPHPSLNTDNLETAVNNLADSISLIHTNNDFQSEVDRAKDAEHAIAVKLNDEISRATQEDNNMRIDLDNEINRARNEENDLDIKIDNEINRAKKEEQDINTNLTANLNDEITRAKKAEQDINTIINTNKPIWDDKYTKAEIDNLVNQTLSNVSWKQCVDTFSDLSTTYPNPQHGWTVTVNDTNSTYTFDGTDWIPISSNTIPLATSSVDGKMSKDDKSFLDTAKSALTDITNHIKNTVKHITSAERTLWNTVSNKLDKSGGKISNPNYRGQLEINRDMNGDDYYAEIVFSNQVKKYGGLGFSGKDGAVVSNADASKRYKIYHEGNKPKLSELTNDAGYIKDTDSVATQTHTHKNKTVLDKIDQSSLDNWNDGKRKIAMVGSDSANSNGWYKVASQTCSSYGNTNITFMVTSTFGNYYSGILQLQIRSDKTSISCSFFKWLNRSKLDINNFIIVINGMTWTLYAYQQCPQYGRIVFEVLSMSGIADKNLQWNLDFKNNYIKETTTPIATVTSSDVVNQATLDKITEANVKTLNDITNGIGGRNLVLNTSDSYITENGFTNASNYCFFSHKVLLKDLVIGDKITVSFMVNYSNLTSTNNLKLIRLQGSGDVTSWNNGCFPAYVLPIKYGNNISKEIKISYTLDITKEMLKNSYWVINFRSDYIQSGSFSIKCLKIEKGTIQTAWTPAIEDNMRLVIGETLPKVSNRKENTLYFRIIK